MKSKLAAAGLIAIALATAPLSSAQAEPWHHGGFGHGGGWGHGGWHGHGGGGLFLGIGAGVAAITGAAVALATAPFNVVANVAAPGPVYAEAEYPQPVYAAPQPVYSGYPVYAQPQVVAYAPAYGPGYYYYGHHGYYRRY